MDKLLSFDSGATPIMQASTSNTQEPQLTIAAIDVGSPKKGNVGWGPSTEDIHAPPPLKTFDQFIDHLAERLRHGPVALGLECPLFIPIRRSLRDLTSQRAGEMTKFAGKSQTLAWSSQIGALPCIQGISIAAYALRHLKEACGDHTETHLDWSPFAVAKSGLFLWEAFVAGDAKPGNPYEHHADARAAAIAFEKRLAGGWGKPESDIEPQAWTGEVTNEYFSLIGACLFWSGWTDDPTILTKPALAIKPPPYRGPA